MGGSGSVRYVFFRPDEVARERTFIPSALFNRCRLLLSRCGADHALVPIFSMQYQAVIESREIFFVDNQAYAVRDGEGGKLIMLAWEFADAAARSSLAEPMPIALVSYRPAGRDTHRRLMSEFPKALERAEELAGKKGCGPAGRKVLRFPTPGGEASLPRFGRGLAVSPRGLGSHARVH